MSASQTAHQERRQSLLQIKNNVENVLDSWKIFNKKIILQVYMK